MENHLYQSYSISISKNEPQKLVKKSKETIVVS